MKRFYLLTLFFLSFILNATYAQSVKELIDSGNSVFIEVVDKKDNTKGAYDSFIHHLKGEEWNRWNIVESKDKADFICKLNIDKKGFNIMSFTSMGARVRVVTEILNKDGKSVWKSKQQQGNVSAYTGGDALSDAMRKVIRRSLKQELYGERE